MIYLLLAVGIFFARPNGLFQRNTANSVKRFAKITTAAVVIATVLILTIPMSLPRVWNGEKPGHRNQYEVMAESLLHGHIYMDYDDVDPRLSELENPYDPAARKASGVKYHWDHAWYQGRYYMYFGIVPVLLLFLPFRAVTGNDLTTYIGTAVFAGAAIVGLFALLRLLCRRFFLKLPLSVYLSFSVALSFMSVYYSTKAPALYCTAIISAVAMIVWSFYFFSKAVFDAENGTRETLFAVIGSTLGALSFGCRPTVALANLIAIPMLIHYVRKKKNDRRVWLRIVLAVLPYVLILGGLFTYNYVRFGDPFEFGQAYQLTVADQSQYGRLFAGMSLKKAFLGVVEMFFFAGKTTKTFPWIGYSGVFLNFPILLAVFLLFLPKTLQKARRKALLSVLIAIFITPIIITLLDTAWTPYLLERYRSDIYFIVGTGAFIALASVYERLRNERMKSFFSTAAAVVSMLTAVGAVMLYLLPNDSSFTAESANNLAAAAGWLFFAK